MNLHLWWTSSPSTFVCLDFFFLYRADSARNRQIDEFAAASFTWKPSDRWINSQFYLHLWWTSSPSPFFSLVCSWLFLCTGPIPPEIAKLTNLRSLSLQENQLTGQYFHNSSLWSWTRIAASKRPWWTSSPSPPFHCFVLTLYRANSARNRQVEEFAEAWFSWEPADRSINSRFYPIILKAYLYVTFSCCCVSTLYRANSARNLQIDEIAGTCFMHKPADRLIIQNFTQWSWRRFSTSKRPWWTSSPSPFFRCFVLTLFV